MADRYDFPVASRKYSWGERGQASLKAFFPLMTPVIILGGILLGIFTPTEASVVAVAYALFIGLFVIRTLKFNEIPSVLTTSGLTSAVVLLLVGSAMSFKTVVSLSHAPEIMAEWILSLTENLAVVAAHKSITVRGGDVLRCWSSDHHFGPDSRSDIR